MCFNVLKDDNKLLLIIVLFFFLLLSCRRQQWANLLSSSFSLCSCVLKYNTMISKCSSSFSFFCSTLDDKPSSLFSSYSSCYCAPKDDDKFFLIVILFFFLLLDYKRQQSASSLSSSFSLCYYALEDDDEQMFIIVFFMLFNYKRWQWAKLVVIFMFFVFLCSKRWRQTNVRHHLLPIAQLRKMMTSLACCYLHVFHVLML